VVAVVKVEVVKPLV